MQNLQHLAKTFGRTLSNNSPTILTAVASTGVLTTAVLAVKGTPKAMELIALEDQHRTSSEPMSKLDIVKLTWKCYAPSAAVGITTIACIVGANTISSKRNAALMSVYSLTDQAFKEYQAKVTDTIGEKKEKAIRDEVAVDRIKNDPIGGREVFITGAGEQTCYDAWTGRYFKSDIESIRKAVNKINHQMINDMYASLNDFYREIGLRTIDTGEDLGWSSSTLLEVDPSYGGDEKGDPCLVITFRNKPVPNYYHLGG